jgi:hypothetical protein
VGLDGWPPGYAPRPRLYASGVDYPDNANRVLPNAPLESVSSTPGYTHRCNPGAPEHADIHRFVKTLIAIRHRRTETRLNNFTLNQLLERARIECHGLKLHQPDWSNRSHSLAISASPVAADLDLYLMLNAYWEPLRFELPPIPEPGLGPVAVLVRYVYETAR